jgi:hypothetical protein
MLQGGDVDAGNDDVAHMMVEVMLRIGDERALQNFVRQAIAILEVLMGGIVEEVNLEFVEALFVRFPGNEAVGPLQAAVVEILQDEECELTDVQSATLWAALAVFGQDGEVAFEDIIAAEPMAFYTVLRQRAVDRNMAKELAARRTEVTGFSDDGGVDSFLVNRGVYPAGLSYLLSQLGLTGPSEDDDMNSS